MLTIEKSSSEKPHTFELNTNDVTKRLRFEDRTYERKNYARLTDSDKLLEIKEVILNKRSIKEVAKFLNTSSSTMRKIQNQMWSEGARTQKKVLIEVIFKANNFKNRKKH